MRLPQYPLPSERGTGSVEFAVAAIVLFMLIFGVVGVSMAIYTYEVVNHYARDASRYAIVHGNGCVAAINGNNLNVASTYAKGPGESACNATNCNGTGDKVTVTVSYPYLYSIPFVPSRNFTMNGSSTMVISQ